MEDLSDVHRKREEAIEAYLKMYPEFKRYDAEHFVDKWMPDLYIPRTTPLSAPTVEECLQGQNVTH